MGAAAPQQQQGPQRPPQQMGPPPPRQQQGPPPPPAATQGKFRGYMQEHGGQIGDALMAMGANMLSQGPSDMPVGFGTMIGQGAQAGLKAYDTSVDRKTAKEREEERVKRQGILDKRATTTFQNQQKDRTRNQGRQDVQDEQASQTFANQQTTFDRTSTTYDQTNILFDQGQIDRAEKMRRDNANWTRQQDQFKAMGDVDLSGLNDAQKTLFGPIMQYMDPNTVGQYFNDVGEEDTIDLMTTDMKNANAIARAELPDGTPQEQQARAAEILSAKMIKPLSQINMENTPGAKGNELYSQDVGKMATSSRKTLGLLNQFESSMEGVNMGPFTDILQMGSTGAGQIANLLGMGEAFSQEKIDSLFQSDSGKAAVAEAIGNQLALEMTNQLAGQISEKELAFAIASIPGIMKTQEGNKMLIAMLRGKAQKDMDRAMYIENQRDDSARLPGKIRAMGMQWDQDNPLEVRDKEGNYTAYGQTLVDAGLFGDADDGWEDE